MIKRNVIIIISVFILVTSLYLGYKLFNLYYYSPNSVPKASYDLSIRNTITIEKSELEEREYLIFNDAKIKNDFASFKKLDYPESTDEFVKYVLYNSDDKLEAALWMGSSETYISLFKLDPVLFGVDDSRFKKANISEIFKEEKITTDIELFAFLEKNKNIKNNIFTSVNDMKKKYAIELLATIALPKTNGLTLINGDYNGYIFNLNNDIKEVDLLKNGKKYIFTFIGKEYFNEENFNELLNSIVID